MKEEAGGVRLLATLATLLLIAGIAFGVLTVGQAVTGKGRDNISVHHEVSGTRLKDVPAHVVESPTVDVTSRITDATRREKWLAAARDLPSILFFIALLFVARSILVSVKNGDAFTVQNVGRLRIIGFLFFIGMPIMTVFTSAMNTVLAHSLDGTLMTSTDISFTGPIISLGVFALGEVFAQGVRLRLDVEGTV